MQSCRIFLGGLGLKKSCFANDDNDDDDDGYYISSSSLVKMQKKRAVLQWLQDLYQRNGDNFNMSDFRLPQKWLRRFLPFVM
jgi:hypothetical protein